MIVNTYTFSVQLLRQHTGHLALTACADEPCWPFCLLVPSTCDKLQSMLATVPR